MPSAPLPFLSFGPVKSWYLFLRFIRSSSPAHKNNIFFDDICTAKQRAENPLHPRGAGLNPLWSLCRPQPSVIQSKSQRSDIFAAGRVNFGHRFFLRSAWGVERGYRHLPLSIKLTQREIVNRLGSKESFDSSEFFLFFPSWLTDTIQFRWVEEEIAHLRPHLWQTQQNLPKILIVAKTFNIMIFVAFLAISTNQWGNMIGFHILKSNAFWADEFSSSALKRKER